MKTLPPRILCPLLLGLLALAACSSDDEPTGITATPAPDQRRILLTEEIPSFAQDLEAIADLVNAGLPGSDPDVTPVYDESLGTWSWTRAEGETDSLMLGRMARTLDVAVGYLAGGAPVRDRVDADGVEISVVLDYLLEDYDPDTGAKTYAARTMNLTLGLADDALSADTIRLAGDGIGRIEGGISTSGTNWGAGFLDETAVTCDLAFSENRCPDGQLRLETDTATLFTVTADSLASQGTWRYLGGAASGAVAWACSPPADSE
jgi:hypothetical protein